MIMEVTKIFSMVLENLHFFDSLNFLPISLKSVHKSFDLTHKKGYYNHLFSKANNLDYVGLYSKSKFYRADYMSGDERPQFFECYEKQKDTIFCSKHELLDYCMDDVNLMRQAFGAFRNLIMKLVKIEPLREV
jgi:hypothetical protein